MNQREKTEMIEKCKNIDMSNKYALCECFRNRVKYGCKYDPETEKKLDEMERVCKKLINTPWWVELLD